MRDLIFACLLREGDEEKDSLRLARSIRTFGGELCFNSIWVLSRKKEEDLSLKTRQELFSIGGRLVTLEMDGEETQFPFASYVAAAGIVEGLAQGQASYLCLMASDTLVLQPPLEFLLPGGKSLGGSPVHLKLLGSGINDPIDKFWSLIYHDCGVDAEHIFPVRTIVDHQLVRAYLNAGLLVVRPERGILRSWQANFERIYQNEDYQQLYRKDDLYALFMHQAVLAGTILAQLNPDEIQVFPREINYPLHLHSKNPVLHRPANMDQLVTCRYEDFGEVFGNPDFEKTIIIERPLKDWLRTQL